MQSTSLRRQNAVKGCSIRASVCETATAFCRRRLVHCTNDRKREGVRSMTLYNTLRTRQFPHMHNAVSSLIACEDTIMCKGGNGLARSVLHVSKVRQRQMRQDKTQEYTLGTCHFFCAGLTLCLPLRCVKWKQKVNYRDNRTYHIPKAVIEKGIFGGCVSECEPTCIA